MVPQVSGESGEIRAFIDARTKLQAVPYAKAWIPVMREYAALARKISNAPSPGWWVPILPWIRDDSAFQAARGDAERAAIELELERLNRELEEGKNDGIVMRLLDMYQTNPEATKEIQ